MGRKTAQCVTQRPTQTVPRRPLLPKCQQLNCVFTPTRKVQPSECRHSRWCRLKTINVLTKSTSSLHRFWWSSKSTQEYCVDILCTALGPNRRESKSYGENFFCAFWMESLFERTDFHKTKISVISGFRRRITWKLRSSAWLRSE